MENNKESNTCSHCIHRLVCRILNGAIVQAFGDQPENLDRIHEIMETLGSKCKEYIEEKT